MSDTLSNSSVVKKFTTFLEEGKYRKTPERFAILNKILSFNHAFSIEQLNVSLEQESYHVSRATIYNNVELLVKAGILLRFYNEGLNVLQYIRAISSNYTHLVCLSCGKVKEVKDAPLAAELHAKKYNAFNTHYYTLCVCGICSSCARRAKKQLKLGKNNK